MALRDDLDAQVSRLFSSEWNATSGRAVPTTDSSITFKNDGTLIDAAILYADIADSTLLVDRKPAWFAAEIYKAFIACAGKIAEDQGGEITAYDGDRLMAVFIGPDRIDRAVRTAQMINWAVIFLIQPKLAAYGVAEHRDYVLKHVVGIDASPVLVAKIGVRLNSDLVWVGRAANYAAKLSSEDDVCSTYVTSAVYGGMTDRVRLVGGVGDNLWALYLTDKVPEGFAYRSISHWTLGVPP